MESEIVNRVANSKLVTFNLEDFYPEGPRSILDISPWLLEGIVLQEKPFRTALKEYDWSQYKGHFVALHCTTDAIVPAWAYMLIATYLQPYAEKTVVGTLETLETILYAELIDAMDVSDFQDKPVIIKGCAHKPVPENAYIWIAQKIQTVAKSVMYGEACSSVPLFKNK
ncbi:DUF2480 family protein [Altibacter sp. HG106]|uniref:DUF2480 family protein n=1 Tax=Altibacter sp. HG106 TaxID=3023937 RepID=UPI0023502AD3|nr:DUF2480 family protein [Altibacter sp. HG106]MDC7995141.1 DUF2480 family protein [Altibacter sp. HG106]